MTGADTLTVREARLVAALTSTPNVREAAAAVGISERTARRWLAQREHVRVAHREAVRGSASEALDALRVGARLAVEHLVAVLVDDDATPTDRRHAATVLIGAWSRMPGEVLDLDDRLRDLEARPALTPVA